MLPTHRAVLTNPLRARSYARETYYRLREKKIEAKRKDRKGRPEAHKEIARRAYFNNYEKVRTYRWTRKARKRNAAGIHTAADLKAILAAQNRRCVYCRADLRKVKKHLDHVLPLALGGTNDKSNLQWLCETCNLSKGAKHPVTFAQELGLLL